MGALWATILLLGCSPGSGRLRCSPVQRLAHAAGQEGRAKFRSASTDRFGLWTVSKTLLEQKAMVCNGFWWCGWSLEPLTAAGSPYPRAQPEPQEGW